MTHIKLITLPLTIINVSNHCEGQSSNIFIPVKSELTSTAGMKVWEEFFIAVNAYYQNMTKYGIWFKLQLETLTEEEKASLSIKLS